MIMSKTQLKAIHKITTLKINNSMLQHLDMAEGLAVVSVAEWEDVFSVEAEDAVSDVAVGKKN
ncbi:MAG: hypothetical protein ACOC34_07190, partial [Thermotogota bacterium]